MNNKFSGNTGKIALHALAWIILIILPQYLGSRYWGMSNLFTWWFFLNTGTYLVIFYVNYLFLVPRLYFAGKKLIYFITAIILLVGIYYLTEFANDTFFRIQRTERIAALSDTSTTDSVSYRRYQANEPRSIRSYNDSNRVTDNPEYSGRISRNRNDSSNYTDYPEYSSRTSRNRVDTLSYSNITGDSTRIFRAADNQESYRQSPPPPDENDRRSRPRSEIRRIFRPFPFHVYNYALAAVFFTFFSLGLKVIERHDKVEKRHKELEKEKLNSELALLKNQISPHFFFNTLNNIYSLIAINTKDSQEAVLKLSRLMRYLLYESEQGKTQLSNEIEFMNNYIDLMRLRMSDKISFSVVFPEKYEDIAVPPLLFIPFIENAFKHGITYRDKSYIEISMKLENKIISFQCSNSIGKKTGNEEDQYNGIGLENVTKRLNLLFPDKHVLKIEKTDHDFHVFLEIDLKNYMQ